MINALRKHGLLFFAALTAGCLLTASFSQGTSQASERLSPPTNLRVAQLAVTQIAPASNHTCELLSSGEVQCWGYNGNDALTGPITSNLDAPTHVPNLDEGADQISGEGNFSCALLKTGGVRCWGFNAIGQLGNGDEGFFASRSTPVDVVGLASGVKQISVGYNSSCALKLSGSLVCWGYNGDGELGNGSTTNSSVPVQVAGLLGGVDSISVGADNACAVLETGEVNCWGLADRGALGNGQTGPNALTPVQVGLPSPAASVATSAYGACALLRSGSVYCWGYNGEGALGDGTNVSSSSPVKVVNLAGEKVMKIVTGSDHACALLDSGRARCWGQNAFGQLGLGTITGLDPLLLSPVNTPQTVLGRVSKFTNIFAGDRSTCALDQLRQAYCWGTRADPAKYPIATLPSAVTQMNNGEATITWDANSTNSRSAVTGYKIIARPGGSSCTVFVSPRRSSPSNSCRVGDLANGTSYTFTGVALSAQGESSPSGPSRSLIPAITPTRPTNIGTVRQATSATITWNAPIDNGGSEILGYLAIATPEIPPCTNLLTPLANCSSYDLTNPQPLKMCKTQKSRYSPVPATTCTITELSEGSNYYISVIASNKIGDSAVSSGYM